LVQAARFYSELNEYVMTGSGSIEKKLSLFGHGDEDELQSKLRAGVYVERKTRDFSARWFGYVNPKNTDKPSLSPEEFFAKENISANSDGLYLAEGTNFDDSYDAQNLLTAGYVGAYLPFSRKINLSAGVRVEYNRQQLQSRQRGSGAAIDVDNPIVRPLPSINLAYNFSDFALVRLAYGLTLNRPEFRELAPFSYYDFTFDVGRTGNPNLKTPSIHNFDARFEWYPTEGEIVSLGGFYKRFNNPIETVVRYAGSGTSFTYGNADQATSIGAELEVRKSFRSLSGIPFIQNITLLMNASLIKSEVELGSQFVGQDNKRQLQGQSPYLVNAGLYYNDQDNGFQVNLLYNVIGRRIFQVGDNLTPTIYDMPRNVIDLNITKSIGDRLEIRAGIQDILNQPFRLIQDSNLDSDITSVDETYQKYRRGSYTTLGINYRF
jgi:TonB-dependent receptor